MDASGQEAKKALNILANGLLQALKDTLVLRTGLRVRCDPKRDAEIYTVNQVIQQRASVLIDSL